MKGIELIVHSASANATQAIAATLAKQCKPGDCMLLSGDLGSGKTTFARGFIEALSPGCGEITSPTFTLVQTYPAGGTTLWHFDLYRLKNPAELAETGLEEALASGITLIEWPELARSELPIAALDVMIIAGDNPVQRTIRFCGSPAWAARLEELQR